LAIERLETARGLKFMLYVANCSVVCERCAFRGTFTWEVAVLLPFMFVDVLGWSIAPKKPVLSVLHELAQSVQQNIYILKWDCMRVRLVYRSPLLLFSTYALQPSRLIVRSGLDVPAFATRRLRACHHTRAPSGGRRNCGREISGNFA